MTNPRQDLTKADEVELLAQVGSRCPMCGKRLFYRRRGRSYKAYEIAHIYPLNPTLLEAAELEDLPRLAEDPNHPDNLMPLCRGCHGEVDKPRTREGYLDLFDKKRGLLKRSESIDLQLSYPIEERIREVLVALEDMPATADGVALSYDPRTVDQKLDDTMPVLTGRKIKHAVTDYYAGIRHHFKELERENPSSSELVFSQVRAFYLSQKQRQITQREIFGNVVEWLQHQNVASTQEAAEAVASFFVQNCEVFE